MAKELDKEMLKMMTITERFNYINSLKEMKMNTNSYKKRGRSSSPTKSTRANLNK